MTLKVLLKKNFENFHLDVQFEMGNELIVLFGPSGAGKSVTLRLISGLLKGEENEVILFNENITSLPPQKRKIGYLFQKHSLFPHMSVRQNILFGGKNLEKNFLLNECEKLLSLFEIKDCEKKFPHEISGGQEQRAALARALIARPHLLLLDEPFSALDITLRLKMRDYLLTIKKGFSIPILFVTHDEYEAKFLGEKILYFENGKIVSTSSQSSP